MKKRKIRIGVIPQDQIRARALAIARGDYKPKPDEPRIWFPSMRPVAEVLSDKNRALLRLIAETQPSSLEELAQSTGRQSRNLSRTLRTLAHYGFVELQRHNRYVRSVAKVTDFENRA